MKKYFIFLIFLIKLINLQCLGVTNFKKIEDFYVFNFASEDLGIFEEKLKAKRDNVKHDFNIIIIKTLLTTSIPYLLYILILSGRIFQKFNLLLFVIIFCGDAIFIYNKWEDFSLGIRSAENALINFYLAIEKNTQFDYNKNVKRNKVKKVFIGDEIEKYGVHAVFCEIPGTLPSNNAHPQSFSFLLGGSCYTYYSQRKFLDASYAHYVGDEESRKYRKLQINKTYNLF